MTKVHTAFGAFESPRTVVDELEAVDGLTQVAPRRVPSSDQDVPVADYQDWDPAATRIIQCRISNDLYPGERYESRDEAIRAVTAKFGRVLEANYTPGRAFLRVFRKVS